MLSLTFLYFQCLPIQRHITLTVSAQHEPIMGVWDVAPAGSKDRPHDQSHGENFAVQKLTTLVHLNVNWYWRNCFPVCILQDVKTLAEHYEAKKLLGSSK